MINFILDGFKEEMEKIAKTPVTKATIKQARKEDDEYYKLRKSLSGSNKPSKLQGRLMGGLTSAAGGLMGAGIGRSLTKTHKGKAGLLGAALGGIASYFPGKKLGTSWDKDKADTKDYSDTKKIMDKKYGRNKWGENKFYNQRELSK